MHACRPLIFQNLFGYLISIVSAVFVGRLGAAQLAAVVLVSRAVNLPSFRFLTTMMAKQP